MPHNEIVMSTEIAKSEPSDRKWGEFGEIVSGYNIPVFNEREVRASAGILFLFGFTSFLIAWTTGYVLPMRGFAILFLFDILIRLFVSPKFSPTMALGRLIVRKQRPEFVGAPQKRFAWTLGLALALFSCFAMGWLAAPLWQVLSLCGLCVSVLFLETAFGICVGCELQKIFSNTAPQYCPGDSCDNNIKQPKHS